MFQKKVSKDTPLAEITLRKYEKPGNLEKREIIKKLCLSVGLLQPGDSRDVVVDVFHAVIESEEPLSSEAIKNKVIESRKSKNLQLVGIASSNIRRQIKRLRDMFLIEKIQNNYRLTENEKLHVLFEEKIKKFHIEPIISRIEEYFKLIK